MNRSNIYFHGVDHNARTSNRADNDYYSTPPEAVEYLLEYENFDKNILEPCIGGGGAIAEVLKKHGYTVHGIDLVDRGYPDTRIMNFLEYKEKYPGDIITNPPYNIQTPFVLHCLRVGKKVALLLKLSFLETINRYDSIFQENPPDRVYVFVKRIGCYRNGDPLQTGSSVCYCWYIWDERAKETTVYWIPNHKKRRRSDRR
jgi:hypothetical protein